MLFGWFYYDWTILLLLPAMAFALWAQFKVKSTFEKYSQVASHRGINAAQAARKMLDAKGLHEVQVVLFPHGHLSDHYDPRKKTLFLSGAVYNSSSAAAIGVACHEAGHALQHAEGYGPLKLRMSIIPVCRIGSGLAMPLFLIGLLLGTMGYGLMLAGIACFSLATLFQLITLPVEFNASARALDGIRDCGVLYDDEVQDAKKVLSAAAMTYVAALASSLASLLRLILLANNRRR